MKIRVCAYCRVSTENDDQQNSYQSQKSYFEEHIKTNPDWEFIGIYADEGISGTSIEKRIDFQRMIEDAHDLKFDLILTKEIARFARNTKDSLEYTRKLKKLGIGVFFTMDNINTLDKDGELRLTIMSALAQDESRRTSERVKWGQKRRMEQGVVFGRELLGYHLKNGVLSINEEEVEIVKLIFSKYINEGKGTHVIARELYESNIKSKRYKKRWSNTMILKVLRNEKYVGDLTQKKTFTLDYLDHKKKYNNGEEEMVYLKDHHDPIIDRKTWEDTQEELNRRTTSKEQKSKHSNRYWCSGKLICGDCGNKFISKTKKMKNGETYKAWRCYASANHGTKKIDLHGNSVGCNMGSINDIVLGNVVRHVLQLVNNNKEQFITKLVQKIKSLTKQQKIKNTDTLDSKIEILNSKKQKVINSMIEGIISKEDMVLMNNKYNIEIEDIQSEIKHIQEVNLINSKQADSTQIYIDRIKSLANQIGILEMEEVYKDTVNKIIINKDNILELYLTCLPTPVQIQYEKKGKNGDFTMMYKFINM